MSDQHKEPTQAELDQAMNDADAALLDSAQACGLAARPNTVQICKRSNTMKLAIDFVLWASLLLAHHHAAYQLTLHPISHEPPPIGQWRF